MSSPHPAYTHPGSSPSSYYHQSPPPTHHVYGNHGPGPSINPTYQYSYPQPHFNSHHMPHNQGHRANGRGGGIGGSHSSRGLHTYQNFTTQHPPYTHVVHAPQGQHPTHHNPYVTPQTKYNPTYAPHYGNHIQIPYSPVHTTHSPTYSPSWQVQQQHMSPLPKQEPMPQPQEIPSMYQDPSPAPQALLDSQPYQIDLSSNHIESTVETLSPTLAPSTPEQIPHSSSYAKMGTIYTSESDPSLPSELSSVDPQLPAQSMVNPVATFAIWSRRPHKPSLAPSIIISPDARPPAEVVQLAMDMRTPPISPVSSPVIPVKVLPPDTCTGDEPKHGINELSATALVASYKQSDEADRPPLSSSSQTNSTVPSTSVTETTNTPTVPGSPISSNTSVSLMGTPVKDGVALTAEASSESTSLPDPVIENKQAPVPVPVKKSWASLLQPSTSKAASNGIKNALPTSSVVGFSIPASSSSASQLVSVSPSKKSELVSLLTTVSAPPALPIIRPRGLVNNGNMCFANSVLQVLVYCPPFQGLFSQLGSLLSAPGKNREGITPLVDATIDFLKEFIKENRTSSNDSTNGRGKGKEKERDEEEDREGESFLPTNIYDAMKEKKRFDNMRGGHQEDAEEFLGFYLDTLEEELLSLLNSISPPRQSKSDAIEEKEEAAPQEEDGWSEVGKRNRTVVTRTIKATESPISRIFGGKFRSTLRAPGQKDSVIVEDWRSLRLDIQREQIHSVQDALSYISHPQPVQVANPSRQGVVIQASQQILIESLPPILVLHLKRFCYDTKVGGVVKVGNQVKFSPELEVGPDVMVATSKRPTRYKLFGALYHHGHSASGGHYTLDVLHPNRYPGAKIREGWVRIDDELVSDVHPEDVFNSSERDDMRCAYLLFYKRIR